MNAADLAIEALPAGAGRVPCSWFIDRPCDNRAVVMVCNDRHRAGACDSCMRLAVDIAEWVNR